MYSIPSLQELLEAGVHFGHQVRRGHPRMKNYIYGVRDDVHIIDLTQSEKLLKEACEVAFNLGKEGKILLFVGTKKQAKPIVEEAAKQLQAPYLSSRWIGGFLTNFDEIQKNIKKLKDLKDQKDKGQLQRYTKKEQLLIDKKIAKLYRDFAGVMDLVKLPDAIFVIDAAYENTAVKEANRSQIKLIAIADTNSDPSMIDYPIPGNDDAIKSIKIITEVVAKAYGEGLKEAGKKVAQAQIVAEKKKLAEEKVAEELQEEVAAAEEMVEKEAVKESERVVE